MNEQAPTIRRPATYQDVVDAPPNVVAELIGGELHLSQRPAPPHARAALLGRLSGPFDTGPDGPGGWWILYEPELHLGDDVVVPDLVGWRRERMPKYPRTAAFELAPDWICEVLSPGTRRFDLTGKRERYRETGVAHLWLVDPEARTLEAFALRDGAWVLVAALKEEEPVAVAPFDAVTFSLGSLWPD